MSLAELGSAQPVSRKALFRVSSASTITRGESGYVIHDQALAAVVQSRGDGEIFPVWEVWAPDTTLYVLPLASGQDLQQTVAALDSLGCISYARVNTVFVTDSDPSEPSDFFFTTNYWPYWPWNDPEDIALLHTPYQDWTETCSITGYDDDQAGTYFPDQLPEGLRIGALLLLLAGAAHAELLVTEQPLTLTEVATSGHRIAYATIEVPEGAAAVLKGADLRFTAHCPAALGKLTLAAASLWAELPGDWEPALDPASGMTGLFFPSEGQSAFHAEIGKLLMDWTGSPGAILVLAFECGDIDCECSPLITAGQLRLSTLATEGQ